MSAPERSGPLSPAAIPTLLRAPAADAGGVLDVMLERVRNGSRPGRRDDDHVVCLAIEGGGMRGAVSAGMCLVLEAAGVVPAFDRIYGVSAGALNGWATAAGRAALSATHYQDAASRRVVNPLRPLFGRPVIDFDFLFDELIAARKPLSYAAIPEGPEFRALAISLDTLSLRVLGDFSDGHEVMQAVRASAALPRLGGEPPLFRGERMVDGGLLEAVPFRTALSEGATHVLVLRSRPPGYRKPLYGEIGDSLVLHIDAGLSRLLKRHRGEYNGDAEELERIGRGDSGSPVMQVAVPDGMTLIRRLEASPAAAAAALRAGAIAMGTALLGQPVDLCWQPAVYATAHVADALVQEGPAAGRARAAPALAGASARP
jgi:predicted patatin/cPLA2 family phospholipase